MVMNQYVNYQPSVVADLVYYLILYSALLCTILPVYYIVLWRFLGFWQKHYVMFYVFFVVLLSGAFAFFYLNCNNWLLWYIAFPQSVQIIGLLMFVACFLIIRIAHHHLDVKTVLFWSVLRQKHGALKTKGIYGIIRHPIYAVVPILILGAFFYTGELLLILPFATNLVSRWYYAQLEEKYLRNTYGEEFAAYLKRTPKRFYPNLFRAKV